MTGEGASLRHHTSPGELLRKARERYGWAEHEIAERLHIIPRYVKAIENGDYSQLPGLVFLKGYVRSYARLVDVAEEPLIEQLEQELILKDDPLLKQVAASSGPFAVEDVKPRKLRWYALILMVAVMVGYLAWFGYQSFYGTPLPVSESISDTGDLLSGSEAGLLSADGSVVVGGQSDAKNQTRLEHQADQKAGQAGFVNSVDPETGEIKLNINLSDPTDNTSSVMSVENAASERSNLVVTGQEKQMADTSAELAEAGTLLGAATNNERSADQATRMGAVRRFEDSNMLQQHSMLPVPAIETATNDAGGGQQAVDSTAVKVEVIFSGDCWFDLRDKDNDRIVGLYRSGDRVDFSGQYPLKFIVGAVNAVSIRVNNKALDFSRFLVKKNRAQFTLNQ